MTISIKVADDGRVQTINHSERSGEEWITLSDDALPTVSEDNVAKTYWWDGSELTVATETIPEDDDLL